MPGVRAEGFSDRVEAVVRGIRPGDVMTYGEVAREVGSPGAARAVGNVLRASTGLPWWRVVAASGRVNPTAPVAAAANLRAEGVEVVGGRVLTRQMRAPGGDPPPR